MTPYRGPWEADTLTSYRHRARPAWVGPVFFTLSLIAIVTGGLIAWSNTL